MMARILRTVTLAAVAALGLYSATLGLPTAGPCDGTAGAAPSPTCAGDLRECLRLSADIRQTTFGGRYVTAEDVARCVEAFNACIHGTSNGGVNPPGGTPPGGGTSGSTPNTTGSSPQVPRGPGTPGSTPTQTTGGSGLPQRLGIRYRYGLIDCRNDGETMTCTSARQEPVPPDGTYSEEEQITGTLSGLTMKGSLAGQYTSAGASGCTSNGTLSGPVSFSFNGDGTVVLREGPILNEATYSGDCSNAPPYSSTTPAWEETGTWSAQ